MANEQWMILRLEFKHIDWIKKNSVSDANKNKSCTQIPSFDYYLQEIQWAITRYERIEIDIDLRNGDKENMRIDKRSRKLKCDTVCAHTHNEIIQANENIAYFELNDTEFLDFAMSYVK